MSNLNKLQKLIDEKNGKIIMENSAIKSINEKTVRIIRPELGAEHNQFVYLDGNPVKEGTMYHIHYTNDLEEYFMTGTNHNNDSSVLIIPNDNITTFSKYNSLNKQDKLYIKPSSITPGKPEYDKGYYTRTFARKTNDAQTPIFEINPSQSGISPLYDYVTLRWYISGFKEFVQEKNNGQIEKAAETFPNIRKYLSTFQYYRMEERDETKEDVLAKLGVQSVGSNIQQNNNQTSTQTSTTENSGGSSGGSGGGSGGGGGY